MKVTSEAICGKDLESICKLIKKYSYSTKAIEIYFSYAVATYSLGDLLM